MQRRSFYSDFKKIKITQYFILFLFITVSLYIAPYHEVWADEVQAFLIARDASWVKILTQIPFQEGQPVLWHILLKVLILIFGNGMNITYVSISVMSLCVWLIVFKYNIPLLYKLLIPFSYFFLYQYNIVARNYCLAYLALTLVGLFYQKRHQKIWAYTLSLAFLAETTSFYVPVVAVLGCFYLYEIYVFYRADYKKYIAPIIVLGMVGISIALQVLPVNAFSYEQRLNYMGIIFFSEGFFSSANIWLSLIFLLIFSICVLRLLFSKSFWCLLLRTECIYAFILWSVFLLTLYYAHPYVQHQGLFWGLFLFSVYTFFPQTLYKKHYFFAAVLLLQVYWSGASFVYDKNKRTSAHIVVAEFLTKEGLDKYKILPIGYQTLPFQAIWPREKLLLEENENLYYDFTIEEYGLKHDYLRLLKLKHNLVVIDDIVYLSCYNDLKDYLNPEKYDKYFFAANMDDKGYDGRKQNLYLFVAKDIF